MYTLGAYEIVSFGEGSRVTVVDGEVRECVEGSLVIVWCSELDGFGRSHGGTTPGLPFGGSAGACVLVILMVVFFLVLGFVWFYSNL